MFMKVVYNYPYLEGSRKPTGFIYNLSFSFHIIMQNIFKTPKKPSRGKLNRGKQRGGGTNLSTTGGRYPLERYSQHFNQNDYTRRIEYEVQIFTSLVDRFYSQYFVLSASDPANLTAFGTVFDLYKVSEVCIEWVPDAPFPESSDTTIPIICRISSVLDWDDEVVPTSEALLKQYPTYKTSTTNKRMGVRYATTERVLASNDGTNSNTSILVVPTGTLGGGYVDMANTGIKFLGTKWFISGIPAATNVKSLGRFVFSALVTFRTGR
jgi:hypothetical protein